MYEPGDNATGLYKLPPNADFWVRFRRLVRKATTVSEAHFQTRSWFRSSASIRRERERHIYSEQWYLIHPFSSFYWGWQLLMCIIWLFLTPTDMFIHAYRSRLKSVSDQYIMDTIFKWLYIGHFMCVFNMFVTLFTGIENNDERRIELGMSRICMRYLTSYFICDFYSIVFIVSAHELNYHPILYGRYVMVFLLLSFIRVYSSLQYIKHITTYYTLNEYMYRVLRMIILGFLLMHMDACGYVTIVVDLLKCRKCWVLESLCLAYKQGNHTQSVDATTLYLQLSMIALKTMHGSSLSSYTDHHGLSPKDLMFRLPLTAFEILFNVHIFMCIYEIFRNAYFPSTRYDIFIDTFKKFICSIGLPPNHADRSLHYFERYMQKSYFEEKEILNKLSKKLYLDVFVESSQGLIAQSPVFKNCTGAAILELTKYLQYRIFLPGDSIVQPGDPSDSMFFIISGSVTMMSKTGRELIHVHDGEHFGELGMFGMTQRRLLGAVALEMCEIYRLDKRDFDKVIIPGSKMYYNIINITSKRMKYMVTRKSVFGLSPEQMGELASFQNIRPFHSPVPSTSTDYTDNS